ncbi:MAG: hypothetical protein HY560_11500 [Gemmatimonadetes bacterium]|nr:hypothetical protein [Gemmatimonadota bacterium]
MRSTLIGFALSVLAAGPLLGQEFRPPEEEETVPPLVRVGLFGFGSRLGIDFKGPTQAIASVTLDVADIASDRVRLRPSGEIGFGGGPDTYLANLELMYRFAADSERAVPYVGFGIGIYGQPACGPAPGCPKVWPQFALGFEIKYRPGINWLLEYHGEDALRRHRFFIGLSTRRED